MLNKLIAVPGYVVGSSYQKVHIPMGEFVSSQMKFGALLVLVGMVLAGISSVITGNSFVMALVTCLVGELSGWLGKMAWDWFHRRK